MVHHSVFSVVFGLISIGTEIFCSRIPGLTSRQREMCKAYPDAMVAVGDGIRLATNECRYQFRHNRWNCSGIENPTSFGHVVIVGEFIYWFKHGIRYPIFYLNSQNDSISVVCQFIENKFRYHIQIQRLFIKKLQQ